jgi:hypothetical protein
LADEVFRQGQATDANEKRKRLNKLVEDLTEIDVVLTIASTPSRTIAIGPRPPSKGRSRSWPADPDRSRLLERFGRNLRDHFTSGSIPFRKAYPTLKTSAYPVHPIQSSESYPTPSPMKGERRVRRTRHSSGNFAQPVVDLGN